jgi:hypothetical protein
MPIVAMHSHEHWRSIGMFLVVPCCPMQPMTIKLVHVTLHTLEPQSRGVRRMPTPPGFINKRIII